MGQTTFTGPVVSQNGFIENSFTTAQLLALPNPTEGLLVYNTTLNEYQVYNGSSFQPAFGPAAPIPVVNSVNPPSISTTGGSFDIFGSNFTGATAVTLGGTPAASFFVANDGFIQCNSGSHPAGTVSVNVTTPAGTNGPNNLLTYVAVSVPVITSLSPNNGSTAGGTNVTILGSNFTGTTTVNVGGLPAASFVLINDNQIDAVTPSAAGTGPVNFEVVTGAGASVPGPNSVYTYTAAVPTISSFSIPGGSVFGGTTDFNISGTNFTGTTVLTFNGIPASFNVINDGTLQVNNLPSGTAGLATVVATNAAGSSIPDTSQFTYLTTPVITNVVPSSGSSAGGESLTIYGYAFQQMNSCQFIGATESQNANFPTCTHDTNVTITTPPHAPEITEIRGFNGFYGYGPNSAPIYTFNPSIPVIGYPTKLGGSVFGGPTSFNFYGSGFTGTTSVTFNGNPATYNVISDGQLEITNIPSGSVGAATVYITNAVGTSAPYTGWSYVETPVIQSVSPSSGSSSGGETITVYGYGLTQMSECQFIGATETQNRSGITPFNDTEATFTTPAHVPEITELRGYNSTYGYGPNSSPIYTFTLSPPVITLVNGAPSGSQQSGAYAYGIPSNANIAVDGTGFTGATNVYIGGQATGFTVNSDTSITINSTLTDSVGLKTIQVDTPNGSANYAKFVYTDVPVVTQMVPTSGSTSGGTSVSVYGYGFTTMNAFQFFGTNNQSVTPTVYTDSYATLTTPAYATAEAVQVRGSNPIGGAGAFVSGLWTFTAALPVITSTSRPGGSVFGGASGFDVQGSNFTGATSVTFNGNPSSSFTVTTDSTISINNLPAGTAGPANIVVTTPGGVSNTYTGWSYYETPRITYVDPVSGTSAGGTFLNVYGYALTNMSECQFYGATETTNTNTVSVLWDNLATISSTPAHAAEITQLRGFNSTYGYGPYSDPLYTYTPPAPTFTLGNILVSQGNPVAGAGNIAINQLTGTKMLIGQINNLKSIDFAGSFGPWNPTGTSSTPTTEYTPPSQTGATNNLGFTLNGAFFVSWDYSANQFWGYETVSAPWDWTSGVTVTGPISVPSFAANFGVEAAFTLDYSGNKLYISNLTTLKQYNLPSQYNISNVNNGADDIYDISVDGILSDIKAVQWNNAGTHVYLLVSDGKIWRYTASSAFVVSSLNAPEQVFDANASINTSTYGTPDLNYHSVGMSVKADSEDRILLYMHTSFLNTTENYLIQLTT